MTFLFNALGSTRKRLVSHQLWLSKLKVSSECTCCTAPIQNIRAVFTSALLWTQSAGSNSTTLGDTRGEPKGRVEGVHGIIYIHIFLYICQIKCHLLHGAVRWHWFYTSLFCCQGDAPHYPRLSLRYCGPEGRLSSLTSVVPWFGLSKVVYLWVTG